MTDNKQSRIPETDPDAIHHANRSRTPVTAVSPAMRKLIRQVVDMSWCLLESHFAARPSNDHPYRIVLMLDRWLAGIVDDDSVALSDIELDTERDPAGVCPLCGSRDALLSLGCHHWGICETHQTCWSVTATPFDLIDDVVEEPSPEWSNWARLNACRVVPALTECCSRSQF